jgi:hypothetical protein
MVPFLDTFPVSRILAYEDLHKQKQSGTFEFSFSEKRKA